MSELKDLTKIVLKKFAKSRMALYLYTMKTLQDLKDNRSEIISTICEECGAENVIERFGLNKNLIEQ